MNVYFLIFFSTRNHNVTSSNKSSILWCTVQCENSVKLKVEVWHELFTMLTTTFLFHVEQAMNINGSNILSQAEYSSHTWSQGCSFLCSWWWPQTWVPLLPQTQSFCVSSPAGSYQPQKRWMREWTRALFSSLITPYCPYSLTMSVLSFSSFIFTVFCSEFSVHSK